MQSRAAHGTRVSSPPPGRHPQIAKAQESGITGVPCFIIDGRFVLAGAERAETIAAALMHAEETRSDPDAT